MSGTPEPGASQWTRRVVLLHLEASAEGTRSGFDPVSLRTRLRHRSQPRRLTMVTVEYTRRR